MSEDVKNESTEANSNEEKQENSSLNKIGIAVEVVEEKKQPERPGQCCGECS